MDEWDDYQSHSWGHQHEQEGQQLDDETHEIVMRVEDWIEMQRGAA